MSQHECAATGPRHPTSAPVRGGAECLAMLLKAAASHGQGLLSHAGRSGLPDGPAPGFSVHLTHSDPPESAADLPRARGLSSRDRMAFALRKVPERLNVNSS